MAVESTILNALKTQLMAPAMFKVFCDEFIREVNKARHAGCIVLMKAKAAAKRGRIPLAYIRGWGISTDGTGGLTRPTSDGQLKAYLRAYTKAAVDPHDLSFVEAHGTGTAVGDPIEIRALSELRNGATNQLPIGSIKANIGHTKATAGIAGLIKALARPSQAG